MRYELDTVVNTGIMEHVRNSGQNELISQVETDNTGIRTPPTDLTWSPPQPSPTFLSANAAAFVPTSSLLGQTRVCFIHRIP